MILSVFETLEQNTTIKSCIVLFPTSTVLKINYYNILISYIVALVFINNSVNSYPNNVLVNLDG